MTDFWCDVCRRSVLEEEAFHSHANPVTGLCDGHRVCPHCGMILLERRWPEVREQWLITRMSRVGPHVTLEQRIVDDKNEAISQINETRSGSDIFWVSSGRDLKFCSLTFGDTEND